MSRRRADHRTIVVVTRLTADQLHVTYLNALGAAYPYVMTIKLHGEPFVPIGLQQTELPDVGDTRTYVRD